MGYITNYGVSTMANKLYFNYAKVSSLDENGNERYNGYGYTFFDDFVSGYDTPYDTFEQLKNGINGNNLLSFIEDKHHELISLVKENGVLFNGYLYTYEELDKRRNSE
jgi:hypothetical protein